MNGILFHHITTEKPLGKTSTRKVYITNQLKTINTIYVLVSVIINYKNVNRVPLRKKITHIVTTSMN